MADPDRPAPTDVDFTDPRIGIFIPVPHSSVEGTCRICHGATIRGRSGTFYPTCWNCQMIPAGGIRLIVPISLMHKRESQLYMTARDYKSDGVGEGARTHHSIVLAATLQRFLRMHQTCIADAAGASWDTITIIPSARRHRAGQHPLERVLGFSPTLVATYRPLLTATGEPIERKPNPAAFAATSDARNARVLLIDDTFASGANLQSAAAALSSGGAHVVAAVVVGRLVDTADRPEKEEFWKRQRDTPFDFARCCLE